MAFLLTNTPFKYCNSVVPAPVPRAASSPPMDVCVPVDDPVVAIKFPPGAALMLNEFVAGACPP